jgi:hypothetical protein
LPVFNEGGRVTLYGLLRAAREQGDNLVIYGIKREKWSQRIVSLAGDKPRGVIRKG